MTNKFSDQVGGFISLRLRGFNLERVINLALARGIYIWDIKGDEDFIYLKVRNSGYEAFKNIVDEHGFELEIIKRDGLPFYRKILLRRMGLTAGAILFILVLYIMSSFVWFVDVTGNQSIDRARILLSAARNGLYPGAAKWTFSRIEVEEAMLRELSEISYVECDIKGVRANIKVVEKVLPDRDTTGPCDIIAGRDGVVAEVLVLNGQAKVKAGDVVVKGDVLISGIMAPPVPPDHITMPTPPPATEPTQVRARGQVKARTWYEGYGESRRIWEETASTGVEFYRLYVYSPWGPYLLIGKGEIPFTLYEQTEKYWLVPGNRWGISFQAFQEKKVNTMQYTDNEAVEMAREKAMENLRSVMDGSVKMVDSHLEVLSSPSDPIVRVKVFVEGVEDIGIPQPIGNAEISK